jgi:hypothetical protein
MLKLVERMFGGTLTPVFHQSIPGMHLETPSYERKDLFQKANVFMEQCL